VPNAGPDQSVIYGTPAMLFGSASQGSGAYIYHWEPANLLLNPNIPQPTTVYLTEPTLFYLSVTDAQTGCASEMADAVTVTISGTALSANPMVMPDTICSGTSAQLFAVAGGGTEDYTFQWTSEPMGFTSTLQDPYVTPYVTTTYTVTVNDGYNSASSSVTLIVNPGPYLNLGPDATVCVFDILTLDAGNPGSTYLWSNGSTERTIEIGSTGIGFDIKTYSVTVTTPEGCQSSDERTIVFDFAACSGIGEPEGSHLRIYPNPGHGKVLIENTGDPGSYILSVTDMFGTAVIENQPVQFMESESTVLIDLTALKPGLYMIRLMNDGTEAVAGKYLLTR
jgi:hypothetical protein